MFAIAAIAAACGAGGWFAPKADRAVRDWGRASRFPRSLRSARAATSRAEDHRRDPSERRGRARRRHDPANSRWRIGAARMSIAAERRSSPPPHPRVSADGWDQEQPDASIVSLANTSRRSPTSRTAGPAGPGIVVGARLSARSGDIPRSTAVRVDEPSLAPPRCRGCFIRARLSFA